MSRNELDLHATFRCEGILQRVRGERHRELVGARPLALIALAVVEQKEIARAGKAGGNPLRVMLAEERALARRLAPARVAPAEQQVTTATPTSAGRAARLLGRRRVIDEPQLGELARAEHDHVELRRIVDRVAVEPVGATARRTAAIDAARRIVSDVAELAHLLELLELLLRRLGRQRRDVDVDAVRARRDVAKVRELRVAVLHEVIPRAPLPNDLAAARPYRLDLEHHVGPQRLRVQELRAAPGREALGFRLELPRDHEHVAVGHRLDVVVVQLRGVRAHVLPHDLAVPVVLAHAAALASAGEHLAVDTLAAQQVAVGQQVHRLPRRRVALPLVHRVARGIDEVGRLRAQRPEQRVAGRHRLALAQHAALLGRRAILSGRRRRRGLDEERQGEGERAHELQVVLRSNRASLSWFR